MQISLRTFSKDNGVKFSDQWGQQNLNACQTLLQNLRLDSIFTTSKLATWPEIDKNANLFMLQLIW